MCEKRADHVIHSLTLGPLRFALVAPTDSHVERITRFWQDSFFLTTSRSGLEHGLVSIEITFCLSKDIQPPPQNSQPIYTAADLAVSTCASGFLIRCGQSWLALNLEEHYAWGAWDDGFWQTTPQEQRDFWLLTLLMFGHRQGYYGLHANGLSDGTHDYLIVGPSGSGKSTLAVRLIEQGWTHSGDDVVLLCNDGNGSGVNARALRKEFALAPSIDDGRSPVTIVKEIMSATTFAQAPPQLWLRPTRLLFATLANVATTQLKPLSQADALMMLLQQSAGIMTDQSVAQLQLNLLATLTTQTQPYQLILGRDVLIRPRQVADRLHSICME